MVQSRQNQSICMSTRHMGWQFWFGHFQRKGEKGTGRICLRGQKSRPDVVNEQRLPGWPEVTKVFWKEWKKSIIINVIYRPGVARAVLLTLLSLIDSSQSAFSSQSSRYHKLKTIKARELKFERMFNPHNMSCVTCHMSRVTCHVSYVMCPISLFFFFNFFLLLSLDKVVKFITGGSVINRAYPV